MNDWTDRAAQALEPLRGTHLVKKRATVMALVDARLAGRSEESVWRLPEVCNRSTYHSKWKHDPVFAAVLDEVTQLAREWKDTRAMDALRESAEQLALATPEAVAVAIRLLSDPDGHVQLRAAFGILDRAGFETATKGSADPGTLRIEYVIPNPETDADSEAG